MKVLAIVLIVTSVVFAVDNPEQIHLGLTSNPGEITFTWNTRSPTPTDDVRITQGSAWAYFTGSNSYFKDKSNTWTIHSATVQLTPGQAYTYQVGCKSGIFSNNLTLTVPADSAGLNYLIFGDLSVLADGAGSWADILASASDLDFDTVVMAGDMAYNLHTGNSTRGDSFMNSLQPIVSSVPLMVCAGNHETKDNYYNYMARFNLPNNKFYYTFTSGLVRFLAIHTEAFLTEVDMLPDMLPYIRGVLNRSQDDKLKYPWLIVFGHRPMYCYGDDKPETCSTDADTIKKNLESWFKQYKVDLYVNGHVHNYQRTAPVYQGQVTSSYDAYTSTYVNPASTIYVTTGGPGADDVNNNFDPTNAPSWLIAGDSDYTFSIMNVFNSTHLYWEQLKSSNNAISDSFWIIKN